MAESRFANMDQQMAQAQQQQQINAQQREFNMYIVDISKQCFSDCVSSFNESRMSAQETECFRKCTDKLMRVHHLVGEPMDKMAQRWSHLQ